MNTTPASSQQNPASTSAESTPPEPTESTPSTDIDQSAYEDPRSIAPVAQLSARGLFIALGAVCLFPLITLSVYAVIFGKASEHKLPVSVLIDRRPLPTQDGNKRLLEDVVVIENEADFEIPNITVNLNGQYFLYQDKPLAAGEELVVRQAAFATKSNQRWVPGRYRLDDITVTGKLPSGARGVTEVQY
ncbi:hypothetical protein [Rhodopirellula sallentina]|uniref:Uncharacterized protein n=1 Tax=Rhodopirellula sallentina SM41 TaxID=1263870 RepID=M5U396_9BACT|nr:hypothetical protein [Rhodopirellula sallentina]EMI52331.1 hypothetical protein RSSM_06237 [Rhodopirellula sallentina SM41]